MKERAELVKKIVDIHDAIGFHNCPLSLALSANDVELFEYLLKNGANVNEVDYTGCTVLNEAVGCRDVPLIKRLLKLGADPTIPSTNPLSGIGNRLEGRLAPEYKEGIRSDYEIAKLLLAHGAVLTPSKRESTTPLFYANDYNTAKLYLEHGVDINHQNYNGATAFIYLANSAESIGADEVIRMMELYIQHGANINAVANDYCAYGTALDGVLFDEAPGTQKIIDFLRKNGARREVELQK
ncbi:hypothetical protein SDC9_161957 [bioreactor metagenome]|uniref:Uncharacterized protein n=1 Tax=bioreactor metagenome TaxID=1076179 RepID=A0A645FL04_9ZZZZ